MQIKFVRKGHSKKHFAWRIGSQIALARRGAADVLPSNADLSACSRSFRMPRNDYGYHVSLHLREPELIARGLEHFTFNQPSLLDEVKLPAFESGQPQVWPPRGKIDPAVFALVPHNRRYSGEWGVATEE